MDEMEWDSDLGNEFDGFDGSEDDDTDYGFQADDEEEYEDYLENFNSEDSHLDGMYEE